VIYHKDFHILACYQFFILKTAKMGLKILNVSKLPSKVARSGIEHGFRFANKNFVGKFFRIIDKKWNRLYLEILIDRSCANRPLSKGGGTKKLPETYKSGHDTTLKTLLPTFVSIMFLTLQISYLS